MSILGPNRVVHWLRPDVVCTALCHELEQPLVARVDQLLGAAKIPKRCQARVRVAIMRERLSPVRLDGGWLVRLPPGASMWRQVRQARLPRYPPRAHWCTYCRVPLVAALLVAGGSRGARRSIRPGVAPRLGPALAHHGPVSAARALVARWACHWDGGLLKQRLLYGALRLEPEEVRHQGAGQFLGRVMESEAVESLALSGGFLGLVAGIELIMAAVVLGNGAGGTLHVLLLLGWVALAGLLWLAISGIASAGLRRASG